MPIMLMVMPLDWKCGMTASLMALSISFFLLLSSSRLYLAAKLAARDWTLLRISESMTLASLELALVCEG